MFLSHRNDPTKVPVFPGDPSFCLTTTFTVPEDGFYLQYVKEGEHTGTHYSAPCHFHVHARCADRADAGDFLLPAVVVDVRAAVHGDVDYEVTVADLKAWEVDNGQIPEGRRRAAVDGLRSVLGTRARPRRAHVLQLRQCGRPFRQPGFSEHAVRWLIDRGVSPSAARSAPTRSVPTRAMTRTSWRRSSRCATPVHAREPHEPRARCRRPAPGS